MIDFPKTREEAEKYRYGTWAGNYQGMKYDPAYCAFEISTSRGWRFRQCNHKPGSGPGSLYCKQHAKIVERAGMYKP